MADEDSYQLLRIRERSSVVLHDYLDEYSSTTEYGKLILDERFLMINWIIEVSFFISRNAFRFFNLSP